jgi:hypothetical protein
MTESVRELMAPPHMRPVIEWLARQAGISTINSPLDRDGRTDPLELASMKGQRDLVLAFFVECGWTVDFRPPAASEPQQKFAEA